MAGGKRRKRGEKIKLALGVPLIGTVLRALLATYRLQRLGDSCFERRQAGEDVSGIYVSWHEMLLSGIPRIRHQNACVIVSTHRDGELIARVVARQGFELARGSSTRGGSRGMRELLRAAKDPTVDLAITVDGPRGPRRELKDGVLFAAQATGRPIIPVMVAADRAWRLRSWDRFMVPKPFAHIAICMGEEIHVPRGAPRETLVADYGPLVVAAMEATEARCLEALTARGLTPAPEPD